MKPYFCRDELPDDPDTVDNEDLVMVSDTVIVAPEPKKVEHTRETKSKRRVPFVFR